MIPLLDHMVSEMETRFGETHEQIVKLLALTPSVAALPNYSSNSIQELAQVYSADLPSASLLPTEYRRWKAKWTQVPEEDRISSLRPALPACDEDSYPNIQVLLRIACTLPVTVCENERSNSQIKLLKTYVRSTMSEDRLSGLAMMKIHRNKQLNMDTLVNKFTTQHPRRMLLTYVMTELLF